MGFFHRSESRELAECYVAGLLMDGERKSVEPMSERVNGPERSMQRLLSNARWDEHGILAAYRARMLSATSDPMGVLVIDDTAFPKKGRDSVCVARQYCGASGKTDNCQIGVSMTYVGSGVAWPFGMKMFIPESWDATDDLDCATRRAKTKMPEFAHYRPKWRIALELLDEALADQVPHRVVVADGWYGDIPEFREELVSRGQHYVLGIYSDTQVFLGPPTFEVAPEPTRKRGRPRKRSKVITTNPASVKVSEVGTSIADGTWQRLEIRTDSRYKPLVVEAVALRVWPAHGWRHGALHEDVWLLIERRHLDKGGVELRYFFSNMPQSLTTIDLARLNHERYWIEHGYQQLKEELGLDHHEGRSWTGWHRHVLLTFLAYGYLTQIRLGQKKQKSRRVWSKWLRHRERILGKESFC